MYFDIMNWTYLKRRVCGDLYRDAQDMEAILPLIEKVMHCLEYDIFDSVTAATGSRQGAMVSKGKSRPRVGFTREALWLGLPIMYVSYC